MFNKKTAVLLATVSTLTLSGTANASFLLDSITPSNQEFKIKLTETVTTTKYIFGMPYQSTSTNTLVNTTAKAGVYNLVGTSSPDVGLDFKAFCVDIFNSVGVGQTYNLWETAPDPVWSDMVTQRVNYLFDNYDYLIDDNAAAFQLTLWELINDNPTNIANNLSKGDFTVSGTPPTNTSAENASINLANLVIGDVVNNANEYFENKYKFTFYDPKGKDENNIHQMLMSWNVISDEIDNPIPEPGSLLLIGLGLFALATFTKRREEDNNYFAAMA